MISVGLVIASHFWALYVNAFFRFIRNIYINLRSLNANALTGQMQGTDHAIMYWTRLQAK